MIGGTKHHTGGKKGRVNTHAPDMLRDMRFVCRFEESRDKTPGQKACRTVLKENPESFLAQMTRLETLARGERAKEKASQQVPPQIVLPAADDSAAVAGQGPPPCEDDAEERCLLLVAQMLESLAVPPTPG